MALAAPPGAKPVVSIQAVTHHYGKVVALDGISLDIPSGIMVGIVGPDGVGKSTLMALMAGSKKLQQGSMTVLDGNIGDVRHRRAIRLLLQDVASGPRRSSDRRYAGIEHCQLRWRRRRCASRC